MTRRVFFWCAAKGSSGPTRRVLSSIGTVGSSVPSCAGRRVVFHHIVQCSRVSSAHSCGLARPGQLLCCKKVPGSQGGSGLAATRGQPVGPSKWWRTIRSASMTTCQHRRVRLPAPAGGLCHVLCRALHPLKPCVNCELPTARFLAISVAAAMEDSEHAPGDWQNGLGPYCQSSFDISLLVGLGAMPVDLCQRSRQLTAKAWQAQAAARLQSEKQCAGCN